MGDAVPTDPHRLRVGVVAHYYPPHVGGLEAVARQVSVGLARRGHRVEVLTSACPGPSGRRLEDGVVVQRVRAANWFEPQGIPFPVFGAGVLWQAWRLVRRSDVVHIHDMLYLSSWVTAILCRVLRTPYLVTLHVGMVDHPARIVRLVQAVVLRTLGSVVLRGAATVLPISPVIEAWILAKLPGLRTRVLRNGIDREGFRPAHPGEREQIRRRFGLPQEDPLVLYVGRFVPKKGFDVVSAAVADDYRLVFVGGDRPVDLPESPQRIFLGALPPEDTSAVYRACDIFVCASVGEGPMTPMEALCSGCAVLVNDDPAMQALGLGSAVRTLPMSPGTLRTTLDQLAGDENQVVALREEGRRVAESLPTWDEHLDTLENLLRAVNGGAVFPDLPSRNLRPSLRVVGGVDRPDARRSDALHEGETHDDRRPTAP